MSLLLTLVWLIVALMLWWPLAQAAPRAMVGIEPGEEDALDRAFGAAFGLIGAVLWPLVAIGFVIWCVSRGIWSRVLDDRSGDAGAHDATRGEVGHG